MSTGMRLNTGTSMLGAGSIGKQRQRALQMIAEGQGQDVAVQNEQIQEAEADNMAKFLQSVGMLTAGRGINKATTTPALNAGLRPFYPQFFGMEPKNAVPYQKIILDQHNLKAVLNGFQEEQSGAAGASPSDVANIVANVQRSEGIMADALNKAKNDSIYQGMSTSFAKNLYEIQMKNLRENSIYALQ